MYFKKYINYIKKNWNLIKDENNSAITIVKTIETNDINLIKDKLKKCFEYAKVFPRPLSFEIICDLDITNELKRETAEIAKINNGIADLSFMESKIIVYWNKFNKKCTCNHF